MIYLKKNAEHVGVNGRSYEAAMIETKAITRLAKAAGKTYGVGAITLTHGESDAGNKIMRPSCTSCGPTTMPTFRLSPDRNRRSR